MFPISSQTGRRRRSVGVVVITLLTATVLSLWIPLCHSFSLSLEGTAPRITGPWNSSRRRHGHGHGHGQHRQQPQQNVASTITTTSWTAPWSSLVCRLSSNNDNSSYGRRLPFPDWTDDSRINVRNLLTQRSIQSFIFLCENVRDPHSGRWIEQFLQFDNQLSYHGTGARYVTDPSILPFGGTWDGPLLAMLDRPKEVIIVSAKRTGKGTRGWSKNNPYLEDRYVEFHIDIDPISLVNRILAVREQVAREWVTDLDVMGVANDRILHSYFQLAKEERQKRDEDLLISPPAFERTAVNLMNNHTGFSASASSPLRKGNFDLLYNLCTQASVHRVLGQLWGGNYGDDNDNHIGDAKEESFGWLRDFYVDRVAEYFDGDQSYGRADDFIEDLLRCPPTVLQREDGTMALADPFGLAEMIIMTRNEIVTEWKDAMSNVPADHQDGIRRILLNKQMETWGSKFSSNTGGTDVSSGSDGGTTNFQ